MNENFTIRRMLPNEIQIALDWAATEGWNPGLYDAQSFHLADPNGFFVGLLNDTPVAVGSAVLYDSNFAFCGLYIVHPDYRERGYGIALTRARLAYVGDRNAGIDGVVENIKIYQRVGYRLAHLNARYRGIGGNVEEVDPNIVELSGIPFPQLREYDRQCFPAHRDNFLKSWIDQPLGKAYGYMRNGSLQGYAVRRKCIDGNKIGPLFADSGTIAGKLMDALLTDIPDSHFYLDINRENDQAMNLVENYSMEEIFATGRMYLKEKPEVAEKKIFGITTYELG